MRYIFLLSAILTGFLWTFCFDPTIPEFLMYWLYGMFMSLYATTAQIERTWREDNR